LVEDVFLTFVGFHISFALVVFSVVLRGEVCCCNGGVFTFGVGITLASCRCFSYINVVANFFAVAGWLSSICLLKISSSVSIASSAIVSSIGFCIVVVFYGLIVVGGVVFPLSSAVRLTWSYLMVATQSDAPSKSSKFLILLRTPST
jgi:hypothetical protein